MNHTRYIILVMGNLSPCIYSNIDTTIVVSIVDISMDDWLLITRLVSGEGVSARYIEPCNGSLIDFYTHCTPYTTD